MYLYHHRITIVLARASPPYSCTLLSSEMALDDKWDKVPQNAGLVAKTIGIRTGDGSWLRCKVASVAKKRRQTARAMEAAGGGAGQSAPKVVLDVWKRKPGFHGSFPFVTNGTLDVTTDELSSDDYGDSWILIVDKPPPSPVIDHTLCCYRDHGLCLVETEIAAGTGNLTTAISPCANHPGVFLHHRCQVMTEVAMKEQSGRNFGTSRSEISAMPAS